MLIRIFWNISLKSTARPQVAWFLVPGKKCVPQKPCIMRLVKTKKMGQNPRKLEKINVKSVYLQGLWSKSAFLKYIFGPNSKLHIYKVCSPRGHLSWGLTAFIIQYMWFIQSKPVNYLQISILGWFLLPWFSTLWST